MSKQKQTITNFNGYFQFLNNDFPTWVMLDNQLYPSITTAFQAARCDDLKVRKQIQEAEDFETLRKIVLEIKNPVDWAQRRYKVMEVLIRDKFRRNKEIREKLKATQDRQLVNTFETDGQNEMYWGVCKNKGTNCLGKILMGIREEIKKGNDIERWLVDNGLQRNSLLWPKFYLKCWKQGQIVGKLESSHKSFYTLGSLDINTFRLDHPSISKSHAVIFFSKQIKAYLVDLQSTGGTLLNNIKIQPLTLYELKPKDQIIFGLSTRKYQVSVDSSLAQQYLHKRGQQLKNQIKQADGLQNNLSNAEIRSKLGFKVQDCILVNDIPLSTSYRQLKQLFEQWMKIKSINMLLDNRTGKPVGTALIFAQYPKQAQELTKRSKPLKLLGTPLSLKLIDGFEANKILSSYKVQEQYIKKERKSRSRSRERNYDKDRDRGRKRY